MLGKKLKALRKNNNLTQQQVADALNISRGTYGHYEIGRREPDFDALQQLADYFGVTCDFLLGRDTSRQEFTYDMDKEVHEAVQSLEKTVAEAVGKGYMTDKEGAERLRFMEEYIRKMYLQKDKT